MTVDERLSEILKRHGPESPNVVAYPCRALYLCTAATRVTERVERRGIDRNLAASPTAESTSIFAKSDDGTSFAGRRAGRDNTGAARAT
jgi:hypothetical protein